MLSGVDWAAIAELRKYGAAFHLATQSLEYLRAVHPLLLPVILANVKQYILFNVSAQDAETMAPEMGVLAEDLVNLDQHRCYLRLTYNQRRLPPFSATFSLPSQEDETIAETIRTYCRTHYTTPAEEVDERLKTALIRALAAQPGGKLQSQERTIQVARMNTPNNGSRPARQQDENWGYRGRRAQQERRSPSAARGSRAEPPAGMSSSSERQTPREEDEKQQDGREHAE